MKSSLFNEIAKGVTAIFPEDSHVIKQDLEKHLKATLKSTLERMDLITREEFDIQQKVLARTRSKLEALEKQVAELEQSIAQNR